MRRVTQLKKPFQPKVMSVSVQKREATKFAKSLIVYDALRFRRNEKMLNHWAKQAGISKELLISALDKRVSLG